MPFVGDIFSQLKAGADVTVLQEIRDGQITGVTGAELLALIHRARTFLASRGLQKGDRCGLLAANSIRWIAMDLAAMAEGLIVVPLYSRQAPSELVAVMKDSTPALVCCGDAILRDGILQAWPDAPPQFLFEEIFRGVEGVSLDRPQVTDADPVTIIYTSGTSGEPKGVVLNVGNLNHMLRCTAERLDLLMGRTSQPDRVFHYLPFCFAGSWILLLSCLSRNAVLTINTDLNRIKQDLELAAPNYFLNVPTLLERVRAGITEQIRKRGGVAQTLFDNATKAYFRRSIGRSSIGEAVWLMLAGTLVFPKVRANIGPNLKALICGSAPLAVETQLFFMMLGIPVLQVYGLTETTAICTMDDPRHVEPGKVGPAIPGIEMTVGENEEVLVRGPNIFPGYWNRAQETARVLRGGWFHTGDQGEVDASGNWRIVGRIKNLIILNSGHNIAPEPLEDELLRTLRGCQQVVLIGNGCSFLAAIVTGNCAHDDVERALEQFNQDLPHYKRIRAYHLASEPFSIDNGLLTANGKLKRDAITARYQAQIDEIYTAVESAKPA